MSDNTYTGILILRHGNNRPTFHVMGFPLFQLLRNSGHSNSDHGRSSA